MSKVAFTLIYSCDDCIYSDLQGLEAVCTLNNDIKHGGEEISYECPLPSVSEVGSILNKIIKQC